MTKPHTRISDVIDRSLSGVTERFLAHLIACNCSPNTARAYRSDLKHLAGFLTGKDVEWREMTPAYAADFLLHLRNVHSRRRGQPRHLALAATNGAAAEPRLSPASVNRALAAVSSFYDWARLAGGFARENPITRVHDHAAWRVPDRHRPFLAGIVREQPTRRALRVRTVRRLPRPLEDSAVGMLLA